MTVQKAIFAFAAALACAGCASLPGGARSGRVSIRSETLEGKQAFVLENAVYSAVLVPEAARFPFSLTSKSTGHEFLAHPEAPGQPDDWFRYYGGLVDCLPWVSGERDGVRLQDKGLLLSVPWQCATGATARTAWFEGIAEVAYIDPAGNETNRLRYVKRVTGRAGSAAIRMDQSIRNVGSTAARFTITLHARTAIAGYDAGDYIFAPARRAYVPYMSHTGLTARGVAPAQWVDWPLPEAAEFRPGPEPRHVFVFTSAAWAAAGDDKTGEALVIRGGRVSVPGDRRRVTMAIFMTNAGYLVEACLTQGIRATRDEWAKPGSTILLQPGETCAFTVTLTPRSGIRRSDW